MKVTVMTTVFKPRSVRPLLTRVVPYAALSLAGALTLSACGGSGTSASPAPASTSATQGGGQTGGGQTGGPGTGQAGGQGIPGVTGLVASVTGSTMQVQTRTDQTAVSWTGSTTFLSYATAALADVTVGSCVTVTEPSTGATGASDGQAATSATAATAASVQVRPATNGACVGAGGFGAGGFGAGGSPTGQPTRTGGQNGSPGAGGFARRGVNGLVSAVNGNVVTVQETLRQGRGTGSTATSGSANASPTATSVAVTTTPSTTYLKQVAATSADVKVGECATALGKTDDTGSVAATAVTLRPATNGSCTAGRGGAGGAGGANGSATTGTTHG